MLKRVVLALAILALVPAAAMADGVTFGFQGGVVGIDFTNPSNPSLSTATSAGGVAPTLISVANIPPSLVVSGSNLGSVNFLTGGYTGSSSWSGGGINYFGTGGSFTVVSNASFQALTGIAAGTVLFSGTFSDLTTSTSLSGSTPPPGVTPAGTGAVWYQTGGCPASWGVSPSLNVCSRLVGALTGTLDASLVAYLGLSSANVNGWVTELDIFDNNLFNITSGTAQLVVPEPGTLALFGTGLLGLAGIIRRKFVA